MTLVSTKPYKHLYYNVFHLREVKNIVSVTYYHDRDKRNNFISYSIFFKEQEYMDNVDTFVFAEQDDVYKILVKILCKQSLATVVCNTHSDFFPMSLLCQYILRNGFDNIKETIPPYFTV